jgi:hypothetical protein
VDNSAKNSQNQHKHDTIIKVTTRLFLEATSMNQRVFEAKHLNHDGDFPPTSDVGSRRASSFTPQDTPNPKGPTADLSEIHSAQAKIPLSYWFEISRHQANMQQHRW